VYVPVPILVHHWLTCRQYKRSRKNSTEPLDEQKRGFLASLQAVILKKMKWEEGADLDDVDEDDRAAFEILRKACQLIISYT
jgi:exportin-T